MYSSKFSLEGKVALVTGGSRGIGKSIALVMAEAGADVAVVGRKLPDLEAAVEEIKKLGKRALPVPAHLGIMENIDLLVKRTIDEFGRIDILVNNAGTNPVQEPILSDVQSEKLWNSIMNLNLKAPYFLSRAVAKIMKKRGEGNIINILTMEAFIPGEGDSMYGTGKAALLELTRIQAKEWAQYNIRVNAIAPGMVKTQMSRLTWQDPEELKRWTKHIPMSRFAEPEEVAWAALYLASEASSYTTGACIGVDGGLLVMGFNPSGNPGGPYLSPERK